MIPRLESTCHTADVITELTNSHVRWKPSSYASAACLSFVTTGGYLHLVLLLAQCAAASCERRAGLTSFKKGTRTDESLMIPRAPAMLAIQAYENTLQSSQNICDTNRQRIKIVRHVQWWIPIQKRTENTGTPVLVCDTEPRKKRVRYRCSTDTEIPEIPEHGISVFALPLSECPRRAYNNTYGLKVNHTDHNPRLIGHFTIFVRRAYSVFCIFVFSCWCHLVRIYAFRDRVPQLLIAPYVALCNGVMVHGQY